MVGVDRSSVTGSQEEAVTFRRRSHAPNMVAVSAHCTWAGWWGKFCPTLSARRARLPLPGGVVSRHIVGVTLDNLEHLPKKCRHCVCWELAAHLREEAEQF